MSNLDNYLWYYGSKLLKTLKILNSGIPLILWITRAIEYQPSEKIFLSGGIKSNPSIASFGISMSQKQFTICAATQIHQFLGWSPDLSIIYQFK